VLVFYVAIAQ